MNPKLIALESQRKDPSEMPVQLKKSTFNYPSYKVITQTFIIYVSGDTGVAPVVAAQIRTVAVCTLEMLIIAARPQARHL